MAGGLPTQGMASICALAGAASDIARRPVRPAPSLKPHHLHAGDHSVRHATRAPSPISSRRPTRAVLSEPCRPAGSLRVQPAREAALSALRAAPHGRPLPRQPLHDDLHSVLSALHAGPVCMPVRLAHRANDTPTAIQSDAGPICRGGHLAAAPLAWTLRWEGSACRMALHTNLLRADQISLRLPKHTDRRPRRR